MRRLFASAIMAAVPILLTPGLGKADPYKWCAVYGGEMEGASNCGFVTIEQCRATVSGIGGSCELNRFYTPPADRPVKRARKSAKSTSH